MVIFGIDADKRTHTVVAVDEVGRQLATRTVASRRSVISSCWPGRSAWGRAELGGGGLPARVPASGTGSARRRGRSYGCHPS